MDLEVPECTREGVEEGAEEGSNARIVLGTTAELARGNLGGTKGEG